MIASLVTLQTKGDLGALVRAHPLLARAAHDVSGWRPMSRRERTLCCVGLVFSYAAASM
jgi:hypothetical protein